MSTLCAASLPVYVLTIGDPTGIGPEIAVRFLNDWRNYPQSRLMVIGDMTSLQETAVLLGVPLPLDNEWITYVPVDALTPGEISVKALTIAVEQIAAGNASGLITGPISKENLRLTGYHYNGHTELLQELANNFWPSDQPWQSDMLFEYQRFRVLLLTRHVALKDVSEALNKEQVSVSLKNTIDYLRFSAHTMSPKLCVLGVNPHAGEINGDEEETIIKPVIDALSTQYDLQIDGPVAGDAAFRNFDYRTPPYDCYIATYHDQGLIPMKLVAGYEAVNVTIGLPFIRTSVSHGMAYDIVGQGIANWRSLKNAYQLAVKLAEPLPLKANTKPFRYSAMHKASTTV